MLNRGKHLRSIFLSFAMVLSVAWAMPASAAEEGEEPSWTGELGLGGVQTSGNTKMQSINAKAAAGNRWGDIELNVNGKVISSSDRNVTTSEKYNAGYSLNYHLTKRFFVFQDSAFIKERFSGYKYRIIATCGTGYTVIKSDAHELDVMAGFGIRHSKVESIPTTTENEGVGGAMLQYNWMISPTSSFSQSISSEYGKNSAITNASSNLTMKIAGNLSAQIGFNVTHNSPGMISFPKQYTHSWHLC